MGARRPLSWITCAIVVGFVFGLAREGARAEAAPARAGSGGGGGEAAVFAPSDVALDRRAPERSVRAALDRNDLREARRLARNALRRASGESRGRLRWLLAKACEDDVSAVTHLRVLWKSDHPLRRWAGLQLARRLRSTEPREARAIATELSEGWVGAPQARTLAARLTPKPPSAEPEPLEPEAPEAPDAVEASESEGAEASASAPEDPPAPVDAPPPTPAELLARGQRELGARRYEDAAKTLGALLARNDLDTDTRCEAGLAHGRSLAYQKERTDAAEIFARVATECDAPEIKAWARYHAGRAYLRSGEPAKAIPHYDALRREVPDHSLTDDALLSESIAYADQGDEKNARKALETLLSQYPNGDMRGEARLRLAFEARGRGDHAAALAQFEALADEKDADALEGAEGRSQYWRARSLEALDRRDDASRAYEDVMRAYPLSYHARQALLRLSKLRPVRARALVDEIAEGPSPRAIRVHDRDDLGRPELATAVELLKVGETQLAIDELQALGWLGADADEEAVWLAAAMLHYASDYPTVLRIVRKRLDGFRAEAPVGVAHARWRIGYPHAFAPLVERAAREAKVPAAFLRAVAREESSFLPTAVSSARAYGLVQLLQRTARAYAKPLRLPSHPDALKRPDVNLRVGARFIRELWKRYGDNPALIPAAYNAGGGAVDRWLEERGDLEVDEWIERIPYAETRRYTRRVLQSYVAYTWLDDKKLPDWSLSLPKKR